jgi:hypothetical protein
MKMFTFVLSILRPVRYLIVIVACSFLLFSSTFPAFAIESYQSDLKEGETQLLETQRLTDEVSRMTPDQLDLKQTQKRSNKGLNEVQGDADINKMKRPGNSQDAVSVEGEVNSFLKKVTGNK